VGYAQPNGGAQKFREVVQQLQLTPDQTRQLIPILRAEAPKLQAIKNDPSLSRIEKLQRLRAIHEESNPQVKAILTPEQYQQLQEMRQKRLQQMLQDARNKTNQ
jgi:Spy/CpxP family protein refolding chaperone